MSKDIKPNAKFFRTIQSVENPRSGIKGWNGNQYIFDDVANGHKTSITYLRPDEIAGLVGKLKDPQKISDSLQGVELAFAAVRR